MLTPKFRNADTVEVGGIYNNNKNNNNKKKKTEILF